MVKKILRKKNIEPIFGKLEKNIGHISGKGNEGDKIKKNWTILKKGNEGDEKNKQKKNTAGFFFMSPNELVFCRNVLFLSSKLTVFFRNPQHSNARAGHAQPKSDARAHLKQRKKT